MSKASGSAHRGGGARGDGGSYHGLGYPLRIVDRPGWRERMAGVIAAIPEAWGVHDRWINVADVDVGELRQFSAQRLGQAAQAELACRIGCRVGLGNPASQ
ncbi:hypothetical protein D3C73_1247510 [compost metagenome]